MNCGCEYTSFPLFSHIGGYSRYEHSVGVALIVWHFTQDAVQAAAALFHDIATPVFAHVIDFLRGDYLVQESTEAGTDEIIRRSAELRAILDKYSLPLDAVGDYHLYPLADNDSPRLSSDRLEYTLGNLVNFGFADRETVKRYYEDIVVSANEDGRPELMFRSRPTALAFAQDALRCSRVYVAKEDRYAMQRLSELLGDAMAAGLLTEEDLYRTEPEVIARLTADEAARERWQAFCSLSRIIVSPVPGPEEGWRQIPAKKRCIDPAVAGEGRLSHLDASFCAALEGFRADSLSQWLLGV